MKTGLTLTNEKHDGKYHHKLSFQPKLHNDRTVPTVILDVALRLGADLKGWFLKKQFSYTNKNSPVLDHFGATNESTHN